jgi:hypothetical protein
MAEGAVICCCTKTPRKLQDIRMGEGSVVEEVLGAGKHVDRTYQPRRDAALAPPSLPPADEQSI